MRLLCLIYLILITTLLAESRIVHQSANSLTIEFTLPEISIDRVTLDNHEYQRLYYSGSRYLIRRGAPLLPYTVERIAIPPGASVSLQYRILEQQSLTATDLPPQTIVSSIRGRFQIRREEKIYSSTHVYPQSIVEVSEPFAYRRMQVVDVKIYPVQYFPAEHRVDLLKKITIRLTYKNSTTRKGWFRLSQTEQEFLQRRLLNFQQARQWFLPKPKTLASTSINYDFSTGQWYKIPVTEEGIYQIRGSFLRNQGLDISSISTETIQMFNYGGAPLSYNVNHARPNDLNEIAIEVNDQNGNGVLDDSDIIYFYGRGVDGWRYNPTTGRWVSYHHPFANTNYYILTFNQNTGKRIAPQNSLNTTDAPVLDTFSDHYRFEEDHYNILQSGPDWYWIKFENSSPQATLDFQLPQNLAHGPVELFFYFKGGSGSRFGDNLLYTYSFNVALNGQTILENISFNRNQWKSAIYQANDLGALTGGSNEISLLFSSNLDGSFAYLDFFVISFQRPFIAENNYLKFNALLDDSPREFRITGLSSGNNYIWDVSDFANVREVIPLQNGSTVVFQDASSPAAVKEYIAFASAAVKDVDKLLPIENSPNLRDPQRRGRFLIILPDEFYDAAEALETLRETQQPNPIETTRIKVKDIFREFSSCVTDPTAIRDFLRWAYYNWSEPPEFVLLMGDGSYDYKQIELTNYVNRVPLFQIAGAEELSSRESDHYYVAFSNNKPQNPPDHLNPYPPLNNLDPWIALGRATVNSLSELQILIQKEISYQNSFLINPDENGWQSVLTFVADDQFGPAGFNNEWFHLRDTEDLIRRFVPRKFDLKKIYLTDFEPQAGGLGRVKPKATEAFLDQINRGTLMINYFGHGDPDTWAHESVLTRSRDLPLIQNEGRLPFWVAATCDWGKFDDPNHNSMAEEMLWLENKGGIAVLSSSRPVYASANQAFVDNFYRNLFHNGSNNLRSTTVGEALVLSLGGSVNDQKYRLLGDPTLHLADPEYHIQITHISPDTLKALSTVSLSARVVDGTGNPLTAFQGDALIRVFDAVDSLSKDNNTIRYQYQNNLIFKGIVSVVNGELQAQFIVPKSIKYRKSLTGRISIYAWSDNSRDALGFVDTLLFYGTESQVADNEGPQIDFSFADQPDFFDGDYVSRQPRVIIRLYDDSGINLTQEVGHRIELTIDGQIKKDVTEFFIYDKNSFQSGQLQYTLPPLSAGSHQLKISAWDNLNNLSEQEIHFRTTPVNQLLLEEVLNYPNPFDQDTYFTFQFQSPNGGGEVRIKIYTVTGRLIQELEGLARPGFNRIYWDGHDRDGDRLANGVYLYKIIVDDGERKMEKIEKLAIVR